MAESSSSTAPVAEEGHSVVPAVVDPQKPGSPTLGNETAVASDAHGAHEEQPADRGPLPMAGQGQALFSTDLGRKQPRAPKQPFTPVIARSNMTNDVVTLARTIYEKYGWQYVCFFPNCGHDISDLFDGEDIHTLEPTFCKEVLKYITHDNVYRARAFAREWCQGNIDRLYAISGLVYDERDPLSVVDKVFVKDETKQYPAPFLWHVVNIIRIGMCNIVPNQRDSEAARAREAVKAAGSGIGQPDIKPKTGPQIKHKVTRGLQQPQSLPSPSNGPHFLRFPAMPLPGPAGPVPYLMPTPPFATPSVMQQQRLGYTSQMPTVPMGGQTTTASPPMSQPMLQNPKTRSNRQGSSSYNQSGPNRPWAENVMPMHVSGPYLRQASDTISNVQSSRHAQISGGQQVTNPMSAMMMPIPQGPKLMSPPTAQGQLVQPPPPYGAGFAPQQAGPFGPPFMDPWAQGFPGAMDPRGMPIGAMANNMQYPLRGGNDQHIEQRGNVPRRSSRAESQQGLFNPYGNDRPDWPNVPPQAKSRKTTRQSFSNPPGRGRRSSSAGQNRSSSGYYEPSQGDNSSLQMSARLSEPAQSSNVPSQQPFNTKQPNPDIVNDLEYGCDENRIGPKNQFVTSLVVFEIPNVRDEADQKSLEVTLQRLFEQAAGTSVVRVRTKIDKRETTIAYIDFLTPADAVKGLQLNDSLFEGKKLSVKVPLHYYCYNFTHTQSRMPRVSSGAEHRAPFQGPQGGRIASQARQTNVHQPTYSPQDARSDLPQPYKSQSVSAVETGSSEKGKPEKQDKSPKKGSMSKSNAKTPVERDNTVYSSPEETPMDKYEFGSAASVLEEVKSVDEQKAEPLSSKTDDHIVHELAEDPKPTELAAIPETQQLEYVQAGGVKDGDDVDKAVDLDDNQVPTTTADVPQQSLNPAESTVIAVKKPSDPAHMVEQEPLMILAASLQAQGDISQPEPAKITTPRVGEGNEVLAPLVSDRPKSQTPAPAESASDDEQKNDNSFVSAKESQSDAEKPGEKEGFRSIIDTQVTEVASSKVSTASETEQSQPNDAIPLPKEKEVSEPITRPLTPTAETEGVSKQAEPKASPTPTEKLVKFPASGPPEKKTGARATESLNPFGTSKAQQKAQKKTDQKSKKKERKKKEKEKEDAKKSKKAMHQPESGTSFSARLGTEPNALPSSHVDNISSAGSQLEDTKSTKQESESETDTRIGLKQDDSKLDENGRTVVFSDPVVQSHQVGTLAPLQTQKKEVFQVSHPSGSHSGLADSSERAPNFLDKSSESKKESQQPAKVKAKKAPSIQVAVPNLKLHASKSVMSSKSSSKSPSNLSPTENTKTKDNKQDNVAGMGSISVTNTPLNSTSKQGDNRPNIENTVQNILPEDNASTTSSATIQPSSAPASPSPTAIDFHTPLQTPSGLPHPQAGQSKKKAKRAAKDANKKAVSALSQSAGDKSAVDGEPFVEQLNQIQGLQSPKGADSHTPGSMSYYSQLHDHVTPGNIAASTTASDSATVNDPRQDVHEPGNSFTAQEDFISLTSTSQSLPQNSDIDEFHAFEKENTRVYAAPPKKTLAQYNAAGPFTKLSWERLRQASLAQEELATTIDAGADSGDEASWTTSSSE